METVNAKIIWVGHPKKHLLPSSNILSTSMKTNALQKQWLPAAYLHHSHGAKQGINMHALVVSLCVGWFGNFPDKNI